jgi:hypothetical protein
VGLWTYVQLVAGDGPICVSIAWRLYRLESRLALESLLRAYFETCLIAGFIVCLVVCVRQSCMRVALERAALQEE